MYTHTCSLRVRYAETDQMGYLYHGHYAQYYEHGRVEALRALGATYRQMEEEIGVWMPVVSLNIRFVRPAGYDELIRIQTCLRQLPNRFITFHMELFNEAGKLINGGTVRLCFLDAATRNSIAAPEFLLTHLRPFFK